MKFLAAIVFALLCTFSVSAQKNPPKGYHEAPTGVITGDFNGDGKEEGLTNFMVGPAAKPVNYIEDLANETWDTYVNRFTTKGYKVLVIGMQDTITFNNAEGLIMCGNLGNINNTKGDEIAIVPNLVDRSRHSYCHIYSLCNGTWQEVFVFNVHEDAFDEETAQGYIAGALQKHESGWLYHDYLEMDYDNPDDVGKMMPLKVDNCE